MTSKCLISLCFRTILIIINSEKLNLIEINLNKTNTVVVGSKLT